MLVFLDRQFIPAEQAKVSIFDRSFLYGDGLFETLRVAGGKPFRWPHHWQRLEAGASFLKIDLPFSSLALHGHAVELIRREHAKEAALRVTVSRGVGPRGYGPTGAHEPTVAMSLHPVPELAPMQSWTLITSELRVNERDPLTQFKTANKLSQVLARAEAARADSDEALFMNLAGNLAEGASSNLFWVEDDCLFTPPLRAGALPGITRAIIGEVCQTLGLQLGERPCGYSDLLRASGVFLTLSSLGVVEAKSLDKQPLAQSPLTKNVHAAYCALLRKECLEQEQVP